MKLVHGLPAGRARLSLAALALYCWLLMTFQAMSEKIGLTALLVLALAALSCIMTALLYKLLRGPLSGLVFNSSGEKPLVWGAAIAVVTMLVFLVYLAAYYPGGIYADTGWQLRQAMHIEAYNDWHPVLHTLIFFSLPLKFADNLRTIVLLQLGLFSMAFGYLGCVLRRNGCPLVFLAVICLYVWLNPYMAGYMVCPLKDCGLTIFALVLFAQYVQTVCSGGAWLKKWSNAACFALIAVLCLYMRHNAVLLAAPIVAVAVFGYLKDKKKRVFILGLMLVCFAAVKLLYAALDVEKPDKRVLETIGLPVTVWCNVMQNCPEALPEETQELMYRIAPKEVYENDYSDCFNSIKWNWKSDLVYVDSLSYSQVAKYTWQCFRFAPRESFEAVARLTSQVWGVDTQSAPIVPVILENPIGAYSRPFPLFRQLVDQLRGLLDSGLCKVLFGSVGLGLLALVSVGLILSAAGRTSLRHILPFLCYDFGTMLLLAGFDHRFFMYKIPLWLPVLFLLLKDRETTARTATTAESDR